MAATAQRTTLTTEQVADRYLASAAGDPYAALRNVIGDALAGATEAERQIRHVDRLISRGFVRGRSLADLASEDR